MINESTTQAKRSVAVLFSGGIDSSLAVAKLAANGHGVSLLTCDNGCLRDIERSRDRYDELRKKFSPNVLDHAILSSKAMFREIALKDIEKDILGYGTNLACMGCKLARHAEATVYLLRNGIDTLADGCVSYQSNWPEQIPEVIEHLKDFHRTYGQRYITPVYEMKGVEEVIQELSDFGLSTMSFEGSCVFEDTFSTPNLMNVISYINRKLPLCREYIESKVGGNKDA